MPVLKSDYLGMESSLPHTSCMTSEELIVICLSFHLYNGDNNSASLRGL